MTVLQIHRQTFIRLADLNVTSSPAKGFAERPYWTHLHVVQLSWLTLVAVTCHGPLTPIA